MQGHFLMHIMVCGYRNTFVDTYISEIKYRSIGPKRGRLRLFIQYNKRLAIKNINIGEGFHRCELSVGHIRHIFKWLLLLYSSLVLDAYLY